MTKFLNYFWFSLILLFALIKDLFDILGNFSAPFGGNVLSMFVDFLCITMIILLTLLQRGELKSFLSLSRKHLLKNIGWLLELFPVGLDFLPITTFMMLFDHFSYMKSLKKEAARKEELKKSSQVDTSD